MLSRKLENEDKIGTTLPAEWKSRVDKLLNETYSSECKVQNRAFEVFGHTFKDEVVISFSLIHQKDLSILPVTYNISVDLTDKTKMDDLLNKIVDSTGVFFDQYFTTEDWSDYISNWTGAEFKGMTFYYNVSRENIALTLAADSLLD